MTNNLEWTLTIVLPLIDDKILDSDWFVPDEQLIQTIGDLFGAGTETTASSIMW